MRDEMQFMALCDALFEHAVNDVWQKWQNQRYALK